MKFSYPVPQGSTPSPCGQFRPLTGGFTLIELMLSITILSLVLMASSSMLNVSLGQLRIAESRNSQFREVQAAFETMSRRLETCEINPYYDYVYQGNDVNTVPVGYKIQSDLHFVSGPANTGNSPVIGSGTRVSHATFFHGAYGLSTEKARRGLGNMLNGWGYFVEFGEDNSTRPAFLNTGTVPARYRFRLKELQLPAESLGTYSMKLNSLTTRQGVQGWYINALGNADNIHSLSENVIACVIFPMFPAHTEMVLSNKSTKTFEPHELAPGYNYDTRAYQYSPSSLAENTRHRLPPLVRLTLVALDDVSASRLQDQFGSALPSLGIDSLFQLSRDYDKDIQTLEAALVALKLNYRVFSTTVKMRNARWNGSYMPPQ